MLPFSSFESERVEGRRDKLLRPNFGLSWGAGCAPYPLRATMIAPSFGRSFAYRRDVVQNPPLRYGHRTTAVIQHRPSTNPPDSLRDDVG